MASLCHAYICLLICFHIWQCQVKENYPVFRMEGRKAYVGIPWGAASMFRGEPLWNGCILHIMFDVVEQNFRVIDHGLQLHCCSEPKHVNFPEKTFIENMQNWKTSTFLARSLASLTCLNSHLISGDFLPSFFSSVCPPTLYPRSLWPFYQESSSALQRMRGFPPSVLQVESLSYRNTKCVGVGY